MSSSLILLFYKPTSQKTYHLSQYLSIVCSFLECFISNLSDGHLTPLRQELNLFAVKQCILESIHKFSSTAIIICVRYKINRSDSRYNINQNIISFISGLKKSIKDKKRIKFSSTFNPLQLRVGWSRKPAFSIQLIMRAVNTAVYFRIH